MSTSINNDSPFPTLFEMCKLIIAREDELGVYPGDGPRAEQVKALIDKLAPLSAFPASVPALVIYAGFSAAIETEMAWIYPERDLLATPVIQSLRKVQEITASALERIDPEFKERLETLASMHVVAHAASRQSKLRGNRISLGLVAARILNKIGARRTAESLANNVVRKWQS